MLKINFFFHPLLWCVGGCVRARSQFDEPLSLNHLHNRMLSDSRQLYHMRDFNLYTKNGIILILIIFWELASFRVKFLFRLITSFFLSFSHTQLMHTCKYRRTQMCAFVFALTLSLSLPRRFNAYSAS